MIWKTQSDGNRQLNINMDAINAYASRWRPATEFEVSVVRKQKTVSDPMRRYFWAVVMPCFLDAYGYDPDEDEILHERLKIIFFKVQHDEHGVYRKKDIPSVFGNDSDQGISTKQKYIEWIRKKSAEQGVYTPDPGEA